MSVQPSSNPDDLTAPLWGTGYGNKRHLVDMTSLRMTGGRIRVATTRCARSIVLRRFADESRRLRGSTMTHADLIASRKPCARCQKIAGREASDA